MSLQISPTTGCLKKFNYKIVDKVLKVSGTPTVWAVKESYFQGNFRTFVEIKKRETNLSNLEMSLKF